MPRTLKNNDSLLNFFVGREAFSPVWSEGQVVQMGPGDQASQGGPGGQVVRWSGGQVVRWSGGQVVRWSVTMNNELQCNTEQKECLTFNQNGQGILRLSIIDVCYNFCQKYILSSEYWAAKKLLLL